MNARGGFVLMVCIAGAFAAGAYAQDGDAEDDDTVRPWRASVRNIVLQTETPAGAPMLSDLARVRLEWQDARGPLSAHIAYDHEWVFGDILKQPGVTPQAAIGEPTYFDAESLLRSDRELWWRHRLYRASLRADFTRGHVIAGRQRIAWGSGRLWNPSDRFNPVAPTAIEQDEKIGVDAVRAQHVYGEHGGIEAVWAPGRSARGVVAKTAARFFDTVGETDYALMLGRFGGEESIAADVAANIGGGTLRIEALQAHPSTHNDYAQAVLGYDRTFSPPWLPAGIYFALEIFYNGDATAQPPVYSDKLETRNTRFAGLSLGYDLTPLWRLGWTGLYDIDGESAFSAPSLSWSPTKNSTVTAAAQIAYGGVAGEYGAYPNQYFLLMEQVF